MFLKKYILFLIFEQNFFLSDLPENVEFTIDGYVKI